MQCRVMDKTAVYTKRIQSLKVNRKIAAKTPEKCLLFNRTVFVFASIFVDSVNVTVRYCIGIIDKLYLVSIFRMLLKEEVNSYNGKVGHKDGQHIADVTTFRNFTG